MWWGVRIKTYGKHHISHQLLLCWFVLFCFQSADFKMLPSSYGHARDAYAFGTTVENLLTVLHDQGENDTGLFCCASFPVWLNISPFPAAGRSAVGSVASAVPCLQPLASPVFPFSCVVRCGWRSPARVTGALPNLLCSCLWMWHVGLGCHS